MSYDILWDRPSQPDIAGKTPIRVNSAAAFQAALKAFLSGVHSSATCYLQVAPGTTLPALSLTQGGAPSSPLVILGSPEVTVGGPWDISGAWVWLHGLQFRAGLTVRGSNILVTRCAFPGDSGLTNSKAPAHNVWVGYCDFLTAGDYTRADKVNVAPRGNLMDLKGQPAFWVFYNCIFQTKGRYLPDADHEPMEIYIGAEVSKNLFDCAGGMVVTGGNALLPIWIERCTFDTTRTHGFYSKCGGRIYNVLTIKDGTHGFRHGGFLLHPQASPRLWACKDLDGNVQLYSYHGGAKWGITPYHEPAYRLDMRGCEFAPGVTLQAGCLQEGGTNGSLVAQNWAAGGRIYGCSGGRWVLGWERSGWPARQPLRDFLMHGCTPSLVVRHKQAPGSVLTDLKIPEGVIVPRYEPFAAGTMAEPQQQGMPARLAALGLDY